MRFFTKYPVFENKILRRQNILVLPDMPNLNTVVRNAPLCFGVFLPKFQIRCRLVLSVFFLSNVEEISSCRSVLRQQLRRRRTTPTILDSVNDDGVCGDRRVVGMPSPQPMNRTPGARCEEVLLRRWRRRWWRRQHQCWQPTGAGRRRQRFSWPRPVVARASCLPSESYSCHIRYHRCFENTFLPVYFFFGRFLPHKSFTCLNWTRQTLVVVNEQ